MSNEFIASYFGEEIVVYAESDDEAYSNALGRFRLMFGNDVEEGEVYVQPTSAFDFECDGCIDDDADLVTSFMYVDFD